MESLGVPLLSKQEPLVSGVEVRSVLEKGPVCFNECVTGLTSVLSAVPPPHNGQDEGQLIMYSAPVLPAGPHYGET